MHVLALFLKERNPTDANEMARLAEQYLKVHAGVNIPSKGQIGQC
jgi:hypothetical protein